MKDRRHNCNKKENVILIFIVLPGWLRLLECVRYDCISRPQSSYHNAHIHMHYHSLIFPSYQYLPKHISYSIKSVLWHEEKLTQSVD